MLMIMPSLVSDCQHSLRTLTVPDYSSHFISTELAISFYGLVRYRTCCTSSK